ncbi:MAG: cobalt transporter, partial [Actinobacteria bacterium]|nr:cobalt transporter [Actinomycetota bacterium]
LPDTSVERVDETHIRIDGSHTIDDFNETFGTDLEQDDFHTMAGLVFGALGRAAGVGDEIAVDGMRLTVSEVEGSRISRLDVEFEGDEKPKPAGASEAA